MWASIILTIVLVTTTHAAPYGPEQSQPSPVGTPGNWEIAIMPATGQYEFVDFMSGQGWAFGHRDYARWDGNAWITYPLAENTQGRVIDMKSLAADDVWLVRLKAVFHWNGTEWTMAKVPLDPADELSGVDFVSPTLGWIVAAEFDDKAGKTYGVLFRWDGQFWTRHKFDDVPGLAAIHMVSAMDGWLISFDGGLYRWNGKTWTHMDTPGIDRLMNDFGHSGSFRMRISMTSAEDGWMIGGPALWRWDGHLWREFQHARLDLNAIAMISPNFGWAVGGDWKSNDHLLLFWDGQQWTEQSISAISPIILVRANSPTDAWLLAYNAQTGQGLDTLFRYRSLPATTTTPSPTETASSTYTSVAARPTSMTLAAATTSIPATSTPFLFAATPTKTSSGLVDSLIPQVIVLIASLLVVVGGAAVFVLRRRRSAK